MISSRLTTTTLILAAAVAAACNTTDKKDAPKAGANAGVSIEGKIDDGKPISSTSPVSPTVTPSPSNSGGAGNTITMPNTPVASDCLKADASTCKIEAEILRLTNAERAAPTGLFHGKMAPLKLAPKLSWVARDWSGVQGQRTRIGHDGFPNQRDSKFRGEFPGSQAEIMAENVAMTGAGTEADVAQQFFDMWRHSPGHYANMMGDYATMGVGVAQGRDGWYATEIFGDE